jgi:hypothetical protein
VHGDAADVVAADLALARVQSGTNLYAERLHRVSDRHGATDRSLRTVEHREETVSSGTHFAAPEASELRPDDGVVRIEQRMPVTVAHFCGPTCRVDDVGEEHRGEHAVACRVGLIAGHELGDLVEGITPWFDDVVEVAARQLNIFRAGNVVAQIPTLRGRDHRVVGVLE